MGKTPSPQPNPQPDQGPKPLEQNPEAMRLVDQLKQMGYTGEDVERAMGQEEQPSGEEATHAAPLMIPGMR